MEGTSREENQSCRRSNSVSSLGDSIAQVTMIRPSWARFVTTHELPTILFLLPSNGLFAIVVELWQAKTHTPKSKKPYPQMLQLGFFFPLGPGSALGEARGFFWCS